MRRIIIILFLLLFVAFSAADAQHWKKKKKYREYNDDFINFDNPAIELTYGMSKINLDAFSGGFENLSLIDIKAGYTYRDNLWDRSAENKKSFGYFTLGNYSSDLDLRNKTAGKIESNNWRFGFGKREGYMIRSGNFGFYPYTSGLLMWTRTDFKSDYTNILSIEDAARLDMFNKTFRFGSSYEGGLGFHFGKMVSFNIIYERNNTYQRYLFWKQTGSMILEEVGKGVIDYFVGEILKNTPVAGSIVNFVFKNAFYYGIYQLKSKEMNWPFGGEPSLNFDTFKIGFGFAF